MRPDIYRPREKVDSGILKIARGISGSDYWCEELGNSLQTDGARLQITNGRIVGFSSLSSDYIFGLKGSGFVDLAPLHGEPQCKVKKMLDLHFNISTDEADASKKSPIRSHNAGKHFKKGSHPDQVRSGLRKRWFGKVNRGIMEKVREEESKN